jgi:hypothetical protein
MHMYYMYCWLGKAVADATRRRASIQHAYSSSAQQPMTDAIINLVTETCPSDDHRRYNLSNQTMPLLQQACDLVEFTSEHDNQVNNVAGNKEHKHAESGDPPSKFCHHEPQGVAKGNDSCD